MLIPGTSLPAYFIEELDPVSDPATELPGALVEVETLTGPNGGRENKKLTTEQLGTFLGIAAGGGGGGTAIYADFIFTAETDGPQSFPLPAGTLGLVGVPSWFQPDTGQAPDLANYDFIDGNLVVYAATDVKAGDKFFGQRYYGGTPSTSTGSSGPVQASDIQGVLEPDQIPPLTSDDIADLSDLIDQYKAAKGPLILTAMPLLQTPLNGALEFDGATLYFTKNGVRASIG